MSEKVSLATLKRYKQQGQPITMLTCYDYSTAVLLQQGSWWEIRWPRWSWAITRP